MREKLANKPIKGHFAKADVAVKRTLKEFKLDGAEEMEARTARGCPCTCEPHGEW